MSWTTPKALRSQIQRLWDRGEILRALLGQDAIFPLEIALKRPGSRDVTERFGAVMDWVAELRAGSRAQRGYGYELRWQELNNRVHGSNKIPTAAVFPAAEDALRFVGRQAEARRAGALVALIRDRFPALADWAIRHALTVLQHDGEWERLLQVLDWFGAHPRSGLYLRQLDIPGVDTKYIEGRRALLSELLDLILPETAIDRRATGARGFARRYGLRAEEPAVRFRLLDPQLYIGGLSDLAVPPEQFARLELAVERVFITENVTNGLAFPDCRRSVVVFGLGYGLDRLYEAPWLQRARIYYWGDIDTHGFGILDRLRASLPEAKSFLMDRATLMDHRALWGQEPAGKRYAGQPKRLTAEERALLEDLRHDRLGERVRMEQERVGYGWLQRSLASLLNEEE